MILDADKLSWKCHICKEVRPDAYISVTTKPLPGELGKFGGMQNIRYCNDNIECRIKAETFSFIRGDSDLMKEE